MNLDRYTVMPAHNSQTQYRRGKIYGYAVMRAARVRMCVCGQAGACVCVHACVRASAHNRVTAYLPRRGAGYTVTRAHSRITSLSLSRGKKEEGGALGMGMASTAPAVTALAKPTPLVGTPGARNQRGNSTPAEPLVAGERKSERTGERGGQK